MRAIFVQFKCKLGQAYKVASDVIDHIPEVSEIYSTSGQYDLLGKFYLEDHVDVGRFVTEQLQVLDGITDTFTLVTFTAFR